MQCDDLNWLRSTSSNGQESVSLVNWPPKYCSFAAHAFFVLFIFLCFFLSLLTWAAFTAFLPTCRWAWQLTKETAHLAPVLTYDIVISKWKRRRRPTTKGKSTLQQRTWHPSRVRAQQKDQQNRHGRARRKRWLETVHTHIKDMQNVSEQYQQRKLW